MGKLVEQALKYAITRSLLGISWPEIGSNTVQPAIRTRVALASLFLDNIRAETTVVLSPPGLLNLWVAFTAAFYELG